MNDKKQELKNKLKIQKVKNTLKHLKGVEILEIFGDDENTVLNNVLVRYSKMLCGNSVLPHSKISFKASESEIFSWIISKMHLECGQEYFFLCNDIWAKIKIIDLYLAIKDLWEHDISKQGSLKIGTFGFLLVDAKLRCIMEIGCDSRDEYNYLIDIWDYVK